MCWIVAKRKSSYKRTYKMFAFKIVQVVIMLLEWQLGFTINSSFQFNCYVLAITSSVFFSFSGGTPWDPGFCFPESKLIYKPPNCLMFSPGSILLENDTLEEKELII